MKQTICLFALCLLISSCATTEQKQSVKYPRKPDSSSGRQSGLPMDFYEQAEKDSDLTNDVIVIPPAEVKKTNTEPKLEQ
ncbi:MAG: hypothetical protein GY799_32400 [Desulfobulbaceae bacterium]|nr:hypothetical protein [Desulfobulbaceae bacterium]